MTGWIWRCFASTLLVTFVAACTTTPGANYPKHESTALANPEHTPLGDKLDSLARAHPDTSGFALLPLGREGLRARLELANTAQRTLDLQYFLIENDTTGKLVMDAVLRAADRGTRVRMLVDDYKDLARDQKIATLAAHPGIEIRIFNPYYMRGALDFLRDAEFVLFSYRLNSRMHNKLFIADNAAAIVGGRNIGDEYFAASPERERGDFDVLAVGPVVGRLSQSFDIFWNSDLAVPLQALLLVKPGPDALQKYRDELAKNAAAADTSRMIPRLDRPGPLASVLAGNGALTWAKAEVLYDNPEKTNVEKGEQPGSLLRHRLEDALHAVKTNVRVVSPYLVPGDDGMRLIEDLRSRNIEIRILTNSLAATDMPIAHVGYAHYRVRMLEDGLKLYEVRPILGEPGDGHERLKSRQTDQFALHAKVFVLDQQRLFLGSMNFDYRSLRLNTEIGLLIDSPELAQKVSERFDAMTQPANCYIPTLGATDALGKPKLTWKTEEDGKLVELTNEPSGDAMRGLEANLLTLLPIDDLL
jgi:putative cardiolipin synthase